MWRFLCVSFCIVFFPLFVLGFQILFFETLNRIMALSRKRSRVWTWKTTTHKTLYETRRKKTRRKRGRHDVVGCCRVLQLCEQLHPKKTLVGDGDEFVVVVESSSKSSSKSQRRRSFHKNGRRE